MASELEDVGLRGLSPTCVLRSAELFNVEKFPTARFLGSKFTFAGERLSEVSGMLTLNGRTLPIAFKATMINCYPNPVYKREVCGGEFEAIMKRGSTVSTMP